MTQRTDESSLKAERAGLNDMAFCYVPAGPFFMGSESQIPNLSVQAVSNDESLLNFDQAPEEEMPLHAIDIEYDYWMARFPVTVGQFKAFRARTSGQVDHPVLYVSWHEAIAFCRWLTDQWRIAGLLTDEWAVRLPSEAEWEKAARGGWRVPSQPIVALANDYLPAVTQRLRSADNTTIGPAFPLEDNPMPKRQYPWGNWVDSGRANHDADPGIGSTTPVGEFGGGTSPYGCDDMSGNVWEWTRSLWGRHQYEPDFQYPYSDQLEKRESPAPSDNMLRVLRGGSFITASFLARCSARHPEVPEMRYYCIGFRVVVVPV